MNGFTQPLADERGSFAVWAATLGASFILLLAIVVDSQHIRTARRQAGDIATEAARAGAQAIDRSELANGNVTIDEPLAHQIVDGYVGPNIVADVRFIGDEVEVTVSFPVELHFGLIAGDSQIVSATRRSTITTG